MGSISGLPLVPLAVDVVVAAEDGDAITLRALPRRGRVGRALGEDQQRPGGTGVGRPQRRARVLYEGRERGFVAAVDKHRAAAAVLDLVLAKLRRLCERISATEH